MCANAVAFRPLETIALRLPVGLDQAKRDALQARCGKDGTQARCFVSDFRLSPIPLPVV
jgi:hypothetical protein